jgi:hypothetical protein
MAWAGRSRVRLMAWAQTLSLLQNIQIASETQPVSYSSGIDDFLKGKSAGA